VTVSHRLNRVPRRSQASASPTIAVLGLSLMLSSLARADAVVSLCHTADDSGAGVNLRQAIRAAPDPQSLVNTITFRCNGPTTIQISAPLEIFQSTRIDGGNTITLTTTTLRTDESLIVVANPGTFLYVNNLTLRHPSSTPMSCSDWETNGCVGSVLTAQGVTEFHHVLIDSSRLPVSVTSGTLGVYDNSRFFGNTEAVIVAAPGVTSTTIDNSVFQNNSGAAPIKATTGSIKITNSQFSNNDASILQGTCNITIDRSTFQANNPHGALAVSCDSTISHSVFSNNVSSIPGGAILFDFGTRVIILRADKFSTNSSSSGGGAVFWRPPANPSRTMTILYSSFKGNKASSGGAIDVDDSIDVSGKSIISMGVVSFSQNVATGSGGAINAASSELRVTRGVFADNTASGSGGAIFSSDPLPLHSFFANTLFIRNTAASGSAYSGDDTDFINTTVDSNRGLAIVNIAPHQRVHIKLSNSIISNNPQGGCGPAGLFDDVGQNLQFPGADCGASIKVANPHLDTMYIPLPKSPPMGNGNLTVCMSPPINGKDVYGLGRSSGKRCATGAAESDIEEVLVNRRSHKKRSGQFDCGTCLLNQLQRLLSSIP
jgi:predicted outer membrane repeat protein